MNKNQIRGSQGRTSELVFTKSISIKGPGCKSGGRALKAVERTSGGLSSVLGTRLRMEGIVNLTIDGHIEPAKPSCLCAHRFLPDLKGLGAQQSIMDRLHEVAAETKEILGESV